MVELGKTRLLKTSVVWKAAYFQGQTSEKTKKGEWKQIQTSLQKLIWLLPYV